MESLRARAPSAVPIALHPRLTVVLGATPADRADIRSTYLALTGGSPPALEAIVEVDGVSVPVDPAFADTFSLRGSPSAVIEVPVNNTDEQPRGSASSANGARIARLSAERERALAELAVVSRSLHEERSASASLGGTGLLGGTGSTGGIGSAGGARPPDGTRSGADAITDGPRTAHYDEIERVAESLREALSRTKYDESADVADSLELLSERRADEQHRRTALAQLRAECATAIEATHAMLDRANDAPPIDIVTVTELEQVRDAMLELASRGDSLSRRERRWLGELRETERKMLHGLGHPNYASLISSQSERDSRWQSMRQEAEARLALLEDLDEFWASREDLLRADQVEETQLVQRAASLLGEDGDTARHHNPRLLIARLRNLGRTGTDTDGAHELRLATRLESMLGVDSGEERSPAEVLAIAQATLVALRSQRGESGDMQRRATAIKESTDREIELNATLRSLDADLASLQRAVDVARTLEDGVAGGRRWSLAMELEVRRSVGLVGALPCLLLEAVDTGCRTEALDPLAVAALASSVQLLWLTDSEEVAAVVGAMTDVASVIRVG